jgi:hypothetical protein
MTTRAPAPDCSECHNVITTDAGTPRCRQYNMTPNSSTPLYAPVTVARSLPRVIAWLQGECGKSGRHFTPKYPF